VSEMKLIMESWRGYLAEDIENPTTWGELSQKIMLAQAAEKWPRIGKSLLKFGVKLAGGPLKQAMGTIGNLEDVLDFVPDEIQDKLEAGKEEAVGWLADQAKQRGGQIGAFIVDDLLGMDDSLSKAIPGFDQLDLDAAYENLIDKEKLKKWAIGIIRQAKGANPDDPLPNLNQKLEKDFQAATGAHPDTDEPDVRGA